MARARVRLEGANKEDLEYITNQLNMMGQALKIKIKGPIRLPRRNLVLPTRRCPNGRGSGTYERWWKRISRWFVELDGDEKSLRQILRIKVPDKVYVKIILISA